MCRHANCTHTHTQWHSNIILIIWLAWPLSLCQAELQSWWNENMLPGCYQPDRALTLGRPASSSRKWHWMDESPLTERLWPERLWPKTHWLRATKKSKYLKPPGGCNIVTQFVPKDPLWHQAEDGLQLRLQPHLAFLSLFLPASRTPLSPESFIHKSLVQKHKLRFPTKSSLSVEIATFSFNAHFSFEHRPS